MVQLKNARDQVGVGRPGRLALKQVVTEGLGLLPNLGAVERIDFEAQETSAELLPGAFASTLHPKCAEHDHGEPEP